MKRHRFEALRDVCSGCGLTRHAIVERGIRDCGDPAALAALAARLARLDAHRFMAARERIAANADALRERYARRALGETCECGSTRWRPRYRRARATRWFCSHCGRDSVRVARRGTRALAVVMRVLEDLGPRYGAELERRPGEPA